MRTPPSPSPASAAPRTGPRSLAASAPHHDASDPVAPDSLASALRQRRLAAGLTQEALAERAGLSRRGIQDAERGVIHPQRETVQRLADALGLTNEERLSFLALAQPRPRARLERSLRLVPQATAEPGERAPRHNLPVQLTSFVGRERELKALARLLDPRVSACRLVTLTGPGGCGKTRLALALAAQLLAPTSAAAARRSLRAPSPERADADAMPYPDGVWLVELGPLANPALLPQAVAAVLQVQAAGAQPLVAALVDALRERQALLILDTCEHLLDACANLAAALLQGCPALRLLAASRAPLGVAGETRWPVPSLRLPDEQTPLARLARAPAVRLFVERATLATPGFRLTERSAPAVAQICRRLDGLPLALELAAARVPQLAPPELAARLDQRLPLLTGGSRTAAARHQTMRAAIDWSYNLLGVAEQAAFRRLAVFPTSFTLDAALAVWNAGADGRPAGAEPIGQTDAALLVDQPDGPRQGSPSPRRPFAPAAPEGLDLLVRLVEKSLVLAEEQEDGSTRYRLLDTLRAYAWERLLEAGEATATQERHAAFYHGLDDLGDGGEALRREARVGYENLLTALRWYVKTAQAAAGLALAAVLSHFWHIPEERSEGRAWLACLLLLPGAQGKARLRGLEAAGWLARQQDDFAVARAHYAEGLALAEQDGDLAFQAHFQWGFGEVDLVEANWGLEKTPEAERLLVAAQARFARSLALARAGGGPRELTVALLRLGDAHRAQGDYAAASACYAESLEAGGDRAWSLERLASVALRSEDAARVRDLLRQSVPLYRAMPDWPYLRLNCLSILAGLTAREGRMTQAARFVGAWERLAEQMDYAPLLQTRQHLPIEHGAASMVAEHLGAAAFAAARAAGEQMDLDRAIDEALAAAPRA